MHAARRVAPLVAALAAACVAADAGAQVLRWAEMTSAEIGALDRARTVVVIPGGILEEHGPHLPVSADGLRNERIADDVAAAVAERPGWRAVVLPTVPIGSAPFNTAAGRASFPGSLGVRAATLQALFSDLADGLGEQGFRWIFVVHGHGDPNHNRALDRAGDYFRATYGGTMVHLNGRTACQAEGVGEPPRALHDTTAARLDAGSPHAGALETARTWFLAPQLVDAAAVRAAKDVTAAGPPAWAQAATAADWPGHVGAPRFATLELGRWLYEAERRGCTALALRLLDGGNEAAEPRYADVMRAIPPVRALVDAHERGEEAQAARQAAWQASAPPRP